MRIFELARRKKPPPAPYDPVEEARSFLEWHKERGSSIMPNDTLQLFVPRKIQRYDTKKEREDHILRDRAKFGYDDEGEMIPQYKDWVNSANESVLREGAPIIAGGWLPKSGDNKPLGALMWTSTAKKLPNGKWTSDWNKFMQGRNAGGEPGKIGYVYKVKPNTCVLELDSTQDAQQIYDMFATLGRPNVARQDPNHWSEKSDFYMGEEEKTAAKMRIDFPWQEVAKHFDCVHHWPRRSYGGERDPFFQGWDIESTVWFKPNQIELLGQVPLWTSDRDYDEDD